MLIYLRICNFALIQEIEISFRSGLTVFTGETGAGKSMILQAVSLLRGERASSDLIQSQAEEAQIEAIFSITPGTLVAQELSSKLEQAGIKVPHFEEEGLIVKRIISQKGKNRIYLANQLVSLSVLGEICRGLIDLSSQHEHQTFMDISKHLSILDQSGVDTELRTKMAILFEELQQASSELQKTKEQQQHRSEQEDFLRFQLQELEAACLKTEEEDELRQERERLRASGKLQHAFERGEQILFEQEGAILYQVERVRKELAELVMIEPRLKPLVEQLQESHILLEDVGRQLRKFKEILVAKPERLQEVEERMHLVSRLLKKHGPDISSALQKQKRISQQLQEIENFEESQKEQEARIESLRQQAQQVATKLSIKRKQMAQNLGKQASSSLQMLAMPHAFLEPHIEDRLAKEGDNPHFLFPTDSGLFKRLGKDGWDRCEILFAPNIGEEPKPLQKIASGGELSRILLALKKTLAQGDQVCTYVFDEVDAGIGGKTADQVGKQLKNLAQKKQVLCITHLAQIAAYAQSHLIVEKKIEQGRTLTFVRGLSENQTQEEIARMLGGAKITDKTREHAKELLTEAKRLIANDAQL